MKRFKDLLGTLILFGFYIVGAWILTKWPMNLDRALIISALMALAQLRWYQDEKSPLVKSYRKTVDMDLECQVCELPGHICICNEDSVQGKSGESE